MWGSTALKDIVMLVSVGLRDIGGVNVFLHLSWDACQLVGDVTLATPANTRTEILQLRLQEAHCLVIENVHAASMLIGAQPCSAGPNAS